MVSPKSTNTVSSQQTPLRILWDEFNKNREITEIILINKSNEFWIGEQRPHFSYDTLHGLIENTQIVAIFDISAVDIIIEVDDKDYEAAHEALKNVYPNISDVTLCMKATGGYNAHSHMQGLW